ACSNCRLGAVLQGRHLLIVALQRRFVEAWRRGREGVGRLVAWFAREVGLPTGARRLELLDVRRVGFSGRGFMFVVPASLGERVRRDFVGRWAPFRSAGSAALERLGG